MVVCKKEGSPAANMNASEVGLEQVKRFTYLGQLVTRDSSCVEDKKRLAIAKLAFSNIKQLLASKQCNKIETNQLLHMLHPVV